MGRLRSRSQEIRISSSSTAKQALWRANYVEALAIRGERIVATGDTKTIQAMADPKTNAIDLHGGTAIPGINDAHLHFQLGPPEADVDLQTMDPSWPQTKPGDGTGNLPGALVIGESADSPFQNQQPDGIDKDFYRYANVHLQFVAALNVKTGGSENGREVDSGEGCGEGGIRPCDGRRCGRHRENSGGCCRDNGYQCADTRKEGPKKMAKKAVAESAAKKAPAKKAAKKTAAKKSPAKKTAAKKASKKSVKTPAKKKFSTRR